MLKFKVVEIARFLGVHRNTVTNWIKKGTLKAKPIIGRKYVIEEEDFRTFCEENNIAKELVEEFVEKRRVEDREVEEKILDNSPLTSRKERKTGTIQREIGMEKTKPVGSVLVVGGGIAGIQAVLDLADAGYFVHLVEKTAGIGGVMAQLDKTFPTNDCAM